MRVPGVGALRAPPRLHFMDNLDADTFATLLGQAAASDHALCRHLEIRRHRRDADADHRRALGGEGGGPAKRASPIFSSASPSPPSPASATACASCSASITCRCSIITPASAGAFRRSAMSACCRRRCSISISPRCAKAPALALAPVLAKKPAAQVPAALGAALGVALAESKGKSISVLMAYADRLERFTHWYVQLWAESLGKNGKGTTPVAALGPVDQHSQVQLFIGGPRDKLFTVVTVDAAGARPAHRPRTRQACRRAGLRRQDHRRPGGGGRPRHRRDAGQERLPGAHASSRRGSTRKASANC